MPKELNDILTKLFHTILLGLASYVASSIASLNEKVAIVIDRVVNHEKRLDSVDDKLMNLFQRK